jgi:hypothetical protein
MKLKDAESHRLKETTANNLTYTRFGASKSNNAISAMCLLPTANSKSCMTAPGQLLRLPYTVDCPAS